MGDTNTGCYRNVGGSITNTPINNEKNDEDGLVLVFIASYYCTAQIYINAGASVWVRIHWAAGNEGTWTAWKKII